LLVVMRPDGKLVIVDGQHRALAAAARDDVTDVPCMVFEWDSLTREAMAFVKANTTAKNATPYERHRGLLRAGEPTAVKADEIVREHGYEFSPDGKTRRSIAAVSTVRKMVEKDPDLTDRVVRLATEVADGDSVRGSLLDAIYYVGERDESVFNGVHHERLVGLGSEAVEHEIRKFRGLIGKGGPKVCAQALVSLLNKGRRSNTIDLFG
jgi:hypothetical protein